MLISVTTLMLWTPELVMAIRAAREKAKTPAASAEEPFGNLPNERAHQANHGVSPPSPHLREQRAYGTSCDAHEYCR